LEPGEIERFEAVMLPHLGAAHRLARYLTRNAFDADDVVQEAFLRALRYFDGFRGEGATQRRAWLLAIVRNTAFTWQRRHRADASTTEFDERVHSEAIADEQSESAHSGRDARETVAGALEQLPSDFREVIVLREIEGLSYKEISEVVDVPVGTVMSRLSRARKRLQEVLLAGEKGR
jgi:RNA polymerase sigma factor (sigma-70 family)